MEETNVDFMKEVRSSARLPEKDSASLKVGLVDQVNQSLLGTSPTDLLTRRQLEAFAALV